MIKGFLEAHAETGTEGIRWAIHDETKLGVDGLHILSNGDRLTIFRDAARTIVQWQGKISLDVEWNKTAVPSHPQTLKQALTMSSGENLWINGMQRGVNPTVWAEMFLTERPAQLEQKSAMKKPALGG